MDEFITFLVRLAVGFWIGLGILAMIFLMV